MSDWTIKAIEALNNIPLEDPRPVLVLHARKLADRLRIDFVLIESFRRGIGEYERRPPMRNRSPSIHFSVLISFPRNNISRFISMLL